METWSGGMEERERGGGGEDGRAADARAHTCTCAGTLGGSGCEARESTCACAGTRGLGDAAGKAGRASARAGKHAGARKTPRRSPREQAMEHVGWGARAPGVAAG